MSLYESVGIAEIKTNIGSAMIPYNAISKGKLSDEIQRAISIGG